MGMSQILARWTQPVGVSYCSVALSPVCCPHPCVIARVTAIPRNAAIRELDSRSYQAAIRAICDSSTRQLSELSVIAIQAAITAVIAITDSYLEIAALIRVDSYEIAIRAPG